MRLFALQVAQAIHGVRWRGAQKFPPVGDAIRDSRESQLDHAQPVRGGRGVQPLLEWLRSGNQEQHPLERELLDGQPRDDQVGMVNRIE